MAEKAAMMKAQLAHMLKGSNFSRLSIELYGTPADNLTSQQAGTRISEGVCAGEEKKRYRTEQVQGPPINAL